MNKLHDEIEKAMTVPEVREKLAKFGVDPMSMTVDQFDKFFRDDISATMKLANDINLTVYGKTRD